MTKTFLMETKAELTLPEPLWVFGYGSLCWKAGNIKFSEKSVALIKGHRRRFFQRSPDHRGTKEKPGLVVTVEETDDDNENVVGVAYRIMSEHVADTIAELDYRERGGYTRHVVPIHLLTIDEGENKTTKTVFGIVYVGRKENPNYADDKLRSNVELQSEIIYRSVGESGRNVEYLLNLAEFVRSIKLVDEHVFELEAKIKQMMLLEYSNINC